MSLSASMWTSVTGLLVHGEKMNVVGNNIANVNTVGFKGSRMDFEDFVNQNVFAAAGPSQVGRGVAIGAIYGNFTQGSFEATTDPTDMAISGEGFFKVKPVGTDTEYYTRAGNFRFNPDGYLVDPHGYALQGWRIQMPTPSIASESSGGAAGATSATTFKGAGSPTNIKLDSFTCDPKHTNTMATELNLDSRESGKSGGGTTPNQLGHAYILNPNYDPNLPATDPDHYQYDLNAAGEAHVAVAGNVPDPAFHYTANTAYDPNASPTIGTDPFFGLFQQWNARYVSENKAALDEQSYIYQHTMDIYDEGGTKHKVTVYYDKVEASEFNGAVGGEAYWEYIVTMDPTEDYRDFYKHPDPNNPNQSLAEPPSDKMRGVLMAGTMIFDKTGEFKNMTAYVPTESEPVAGGAPGETTMENLNTWVRAPISTNGYPMFAPNFSGRPNASTAWDKASTDALATDPADLDANDINQGALNYMVELNLGLRNTSPTWNGDFRNTADMIGNNLLPTTAGGTGINTIYGIASDYMERQPSRTKSYAQSSGTVNQSQDGYSFGYLSTVYVDRDGVLYGKYSNGETLALFQVSLYDFMSPHNLRREGGNLFSQTRDSGDERSGPANSMGLGSVYGSNIEQSNVDLATEFVQMITTQRGFQANSKSISTVDTMLETVIGMKR